MPKSRLANSPGRNAGTLQGLAPTVRIWKVAPGSSDVSAWTVATMPMLASAPRMMPAGK
jgi:hypothetical protein